MTRREAVLWSAAAALAAFCAAGLWHVLSALALQVPLDPNEGWNAYHTRAAMAGAALYPGPASLMFNNYPPLSFYVVGLLGGDPIVAGRIVSLVALAAVTAEICAGLRVLGVGWAGAVFAALLFPAGLLVFTDYVGMDDPQLLGHAIAGAGLVLLLREPRTRATTVAGALALTAALFVKHNLVALPLALAIWFAVEDGRNAVWFALAGMVAASVGLLAFYLIYRVGLPDVLRSPRLWSFEQMRSAMAVWTIWGGVPLAVMAVLVALCRDDPPVVLVAIYAAVSVILGAWFAGGAGVDSNAWFDAMIALALASGLALDRLARTAWRAAGLALLLAVPLGLGFALAAENPFAPVDAETPRGDIAFLRAQDGPALCEMLSLCFWAGKDGEADVFNLGQAYATGARRDDALAALLAARHFAVLQFDPDEDFPLTPRVRRALDANYRVGRKSDDGTFYVRRPRP
jgi:hypothetical protein